MSFNIFLFFQGTMSIQDIYKK